MKKVNKKSDQGTADFEVNGDGGYTVTVPSLPGLVTEGDNLEFAKMMANDAIRCYLEGLKKSREAIPEEKEVGNFRLTVKV